MMTETIETTSKLEQNLTIIAVCAIGVICGIFATMLILKCFNKELNWKSALIGGSIGCLIANTLLFSFLYFT